MEDNEIVEQSEENIAQQEDFRVEHENDTQADDTPTDGTQSDDTGDNPQ